MLFLLDQIQFRYRYNSLSTELLVLGIALVFLPLGVWLGRQFRMKPETSPEPSPREIPEHYGLSQREQEVLQLILKGLSNQEIADRLFVSLTTVKTHVSNILMKTGRSRRTQLMVLFEDLRENTGTKE